jgi:hypothetical protein
MASLAQANVIFTRWATQTELQTQTEHPECSDTVDHQASTSTTSTTTTRKCVGVCVTSCEQIALL